ncbi:MAG: HAD family hydrolase [Candidatus Heimdallarchaeota archaeon]|nr:HAD family hydrolase [Candidatus Heimdallarchaeota archaeon]
MVSQSVKHRIQPIEWIIFDFFWTLYRITPTPVALLQRFLKHLNAPLSPKPLEIVKRFAVADGYLYQEKNTPISASSIRVLQEISDATILDFFTSKEWQNIEKEAIAFLSPRYSQTHKDIVQQLFVQWHQYWRKPDRQARIIPETPQVMKELAERNYKLVVASNSPWDLQPILNRDQISPSVQKVITYKDTGYQKPSINFFRSMIKQIPAPIRKIAFVGDSVNNDIKPALSIGVLPILIWRPGQHRQPPPHIQDVISIQYLKELLTIFD